MAGSGREQKRERAERSDVTASRVEHLSTSEGPHATVVTPPSGSTDVSGSGVATAGADDPSRSSLVPGSLVGGRFILIQEIGRGSTGVVFEVNHDELGHRVAIKALHPHIATDPNVMWRFKREAQLTASLKHPNIVSIFDIGQQFDNSYFIVQEFLEGMNLRQLLKQRGRLELIETLDHLVPIMGALVAAHQKGIVHRDVKPENIFLSQTEAKTVVPKLIDFGLAKMAAEKGEFETQIGVVMGTPSYMSPEQALGLPVDARTDVWSLGVVLFEALSGERPFHSDREGTALEKIRAGTPRLLTRVAPQVPQELADLVHRALDRDLSRRFPSMLAFLSAVMRFAEKTDPALPSRHALSVPPSAISGLPAPAWEEADPVNTRKRSLSNGKIRAVRLPVAFGSEREGDSRGAGGSAVDILAEQALDMNALAQAIDLAEQAITEQPGSSKIKGRMRLVQSIACRWLGRFAEAERYAQLAYRQLPKGSARWFAAISNLVVVLACKGESGFLSEPAEDLMRSQPNKRHAAAQVRALGQSAIWLLRADQHALADRSFEVAQTLARALPYDQLDVRVWLDLAEAELALHAGDPMKSLNLTELAAESFGQRGDTRNACLCRANLGQAYVQLGVFVRGERELRAAITDGDRMRLGFLAPVRTNLGFALARLGRLREATWTVDDAMQRCVAHGYGRFLPVCEIHLTEILRLDGQLAEARPHAERAVTASANLPRVHAVALATLAGVLIPLGHRAEALERATTALRILESLPSVDDGEALVRLVHVRALVAAGQRDSARAHLDRARARLRQRASLISDPRWQRTFLEEVPENRETNRLDMDQPDVLS